MKITQWLASLRRGLTGAPQLADWLSVRSESCVACGGSIRLQAATSDAVMILLQRALCERCLSSIPWLSRIGCSSCGRGIACEDCIREPKRHFQLNRSAVDYDPVMRSWLALYKYRGLERLGPILGEMLVPAYERLTAAVGGKWDALTFVPISEIRAAERGFNQAEAMARHVSRRYGVPLFSLLYRTRHAEKMSFKTRSQRLRDVRALFAYEEAGFAQLFEERAVQQNPSEPLNILLVDDIYTTGSTAGACAAALKEGGRRFGAEISVYVLTWARS